jgi:hypothetical protein
MGAIDEIRVTEARRMLGLEPGDDLPSRAAGWVAAGVVCPSLDALALRLLRAAAVELDLTFDSLQAARSHYLRASLPDLVRPGNTAAIAEASNSLTDELTGRARRALSRFLGRSERPPEN